MTSSYDVNRTQVDLLRCPQVAQSQDSVTLQWATPWANGAAITRYVLQMDDGMGGEFHTKYAGADNEARVAGLKSGLAYRFRLMAENDVSAGGPRVHTCAQAVFLHAGKHPPLLDSVMHSTWPSCAPDRSMQTSCHDRCNLVLSPAQSEAMSAAGLQVGRSMWSIPTAANTSASVPMAPPRPMVGAITRSAANFSWQPPAEDGGSPVVLYRVSPADVMAAAAAALH